MIEIGSEPVPGYCVLQFLGDGNFGYVYKTTAPGNLEAACKFIPLFNRKGAKELRSLLRIKNVRSGGLVAIHGIWILDEADRPLEQASVWEEVQAEMRESGPARTLMVAMELGDQTLFEYCRKFRQRGLPGIPANELLDFMEDLARGVDFLNTPCHDLGDGPVAILHCDIKPKNVILIGNAAKLCDFGLASVLSVSGGTRPGPGTVEYSAPERIFDAPSDRSDQYSLAVTYYEMRTGQLPFRSEDRKTEYTVMLAHHNSRLDFSAVGEAERQVLRKATSRHPENRFSKTREMVAALRTALTENPTASPIATDGVTASNPGLRDTADLAQDTISKNSVRDTQPITTSPPPEKAPGASYRSRLAASIAIGAFSIAVAVGLIIFRNNTSPSPEAKQSHVHADGANQGPTINSETVKASHDPRQPLVQHLSVDSLGPQATRFMSDEKTIFISVNDPPQFQAWRLEEQLNPPSLSFRQPLRGHPAVAAMSPDGHYLFLSDHDAPGEVHASWFKVENGKTEPLSHNWFSLHGGEEIEGAKFSPAGDYALTYSARQLVLWKRNDPTHVYVPQVPVEMPSTVVDCFFSMPQSDGVLFLVIVMAQDIDVRPCLEEIAYPKKLAHHEQERMFVRTACAPQSPNLVTIDDSGRIEQWRWTPDRIAAIPLEGNGQSLENWIMDARGTRLVAGEANYSDVDGQVVLMWNMSQPATDSVRMRGHQRPILAIAISHDGEWMITADEKMMFAWNLKDQRSVSLSLPENIGKLRSVALSHNAQWAIAATSGGNLLIWDFKALRNEWSRLSNLELDRQPTASK